MSNVSKECCVHVKRSCRSCPRASGSESTEHRLSAISCSSTSPERQCHVKVNTPHHTRTHRYTPSGQPKSFYTLRTINSTHHSVSKQKLTPYFVIQFQVHLNLQNVYMEFTFHGLWLIYVCHCSHSKKHVQWKTHSFQTLPMHYNQISSLK